MCLDLSVGCLGIVSWVSGIVLWVSGIVSWVSGFVFWVSGNAASEELSFEVGINKWPLVRPIMRNGILHALNMLVVIRTFSLNGSGCGFFVPCSRIFLILASWLLQ